jgi:hypothetical protein
MSIIITWTIVVCFVRLLPVSFRELGIIFPIRKKGSTVSRMHKIINQPGSGASNQMYTKNSVRGSATQVMCPDQCR